MPPLHVRVINWISEIWQDFESDHCGITATNVDDYSNQLRHFVRSNQIVEDIEPIDDATSDDAEIFDYRHVSEMEPDESG